MIVNRQVDLRIGEPSLFTISLANNQKKTVVYKITVERDGSKYV